MLELRLLRAHLQRCSSCADVAADMVAITRAIRSARLEPLPSQIVVPRLRRRTRFARLPGSRLAGQLASVAAGGVLALTMGSWSPGKDLSTLPLRPVVIDATDLEAVDAEPSELRTFRHAALLRGTAAAARLQNHLGSQPL